MYSAELHGKLSLRLEHSEDILTSNVFSFLKYSNRKVFLRRYFKMLGFQVSAANAIKSEFTFWPHFADNTEPDLVIQVGSHYILFEAKYHSKFGDGNAETKAQLVREIEGGILEADSYKQDFSMIAITADYYYKPHMFMSIPLEYRSRFRWTNWQTVTTLVQNVLDGPDILTPYERDFATDLYSLLCKKNLRAYGGISAIENKQYQPIAVQSLFFNAATAGFRGDFIGFCAALAGKSSISAQVGPLFFEKRERILFKIANTDKALTAPGPSIFFRSDFHGE